MGKQQNETKYSDFLTLISQQPWGKWVAGKIREVLNQAEQSLPSRTTIEGGVFCICRVFGFCCVLCICHVFSTCHCVCICCLFCIHRIFFICILLIFSITLWYISRFGVCHFLIYTTLHNILCCLHRIKLKIYFMVPVFLETYSLSNPAPIQTKIETWYKQPFIHSWDCYKN